MIKPLRYLAVLACCFAYGCDRSGADRQIVGSWTAPNFDSVSQFNFYADHTFILSGESLGEHVIFDKGTWMFDAKRILVRVKDRDEGKLVILNVVDLTQDELKIRHSDTWVETLKRVKTQTPEEIQTLVGKRVEYTITP